MNRPAPTYHRQQFLLFLLEHVGQIQLNDFNKLLFLLNKETSFQYYDLISYKGNYLSFQAMADLNSLEAKGWIKKRNTSIYLADNPYIDKNTKTDERRKISIWIKNYKNTEGEELTKLIKKHHIINNLPSVFKEKKQLYTIGYEGVSLEQYISKLLNNNIEILYDIRRNPISRKFGFSKNILSKILNQFDIKYKHIPDLGIVSEKRKKLNNNNDYIELFEEYKSLLPNKQESIENIISSIHDGTRVALMCFEENHNLCHRHCVSDYISNRLSLATTHL